MEDASRFLGVTDPEAVYSLEPWEYKAIMKGAEHRRVDDQNQIIQTAMINRKVQNEKRVNPKQIYNAEQEHKKINAQYSGKAQKRVVNLEKHRKMKQDLKEYMKQLG